MKNLILFKKLTLAIHKIFNDIPYVDFCVGMNNPCSLFQQKIKAEEYKADRKKSIKKGHNYQ